MGRCSVVLGMVTGLLRKREEDECKDDRNKLYRVFALALF